MLPGIYSFFVGAGQTIFHSLYLGTGTIVPVYLSST
jgi:hypothetical protein